MGFLLSGPVYHTVSAASAQTYLNSNIFYYDSQVSYECNFHINKPPDYRAFCIQNICRFLSVHALRRFWFDSILDGICKVIAAY